MQAGGGGEKRQGAISPAPLASVAQGLPTDVVESRRPRGDPRGARALPPLPPQGLSAAITRVPASGPDSWPLEDRDPALSFARLAFSAQPGTAVPGQLIHRLGRSVKKPSSGGVGPAPGVFCWLPPTPVRGWPWTARPGTPFQNQWSKHPLLIN